MLGKLKLNLFRLEIKWFSEPLSAQAANIYKIQFMKLIIIKTIDLNIAACSMAVHYFEFFAIWAWGANVIVWFGII
jgi:hypothetical protein